MGLLSIAAVSASDVSMLPMVIELAAIWSAVTVPVMMLAPSMTVDASYSSTAEHDTVPSIALRCMHVQRYG